MKTLSILLTCLPLAANAQSHAGHDMHAPSAAPKEAGQGGFAALAEITDLLRADPTTDWSQVNLGRLRLHLQDMDQLVTELQVSETDVPEGLQMTIDLAGPAAGAARRMVPAHGPVLAAETGWNSDVTVGEDSIVWAVTDAAAADQIRGLGFFGLMATGNHHPAHHLAIARGGSQDAHSGH
ncbi:hypothetical protein [Sagittula sp.]|uniref:hypothetical protein n=1 Tax=Sagittula sp. TaxID=2038081 RepID=UPI003513DF87